MEYKGYTITQSSLNNHIMVNKDGHMVSHINCTKKLSDEELKETVDLDLSMLDSSDINLKEKGLK